MFFLLHKFLPILKYQTFRGICSIFTAFLITLILGNKFISIIKTYKQPIRDIGPKRHIIEKANTPTMGGILIVLSVSITTLLWSNIKTPYIWIMLVNMIGFALIGAFDDIKKITKKNHIGLTVHMKFFFQIGLGIIIAYFVYLLVGPKVYVPFFKNLEFNLWMIPYLIWGGICVIVGSSNAVNITDGLDGLAIFPIMIASIALSVIAYVCGHSIFSNYLLIPYIPNVGEIIIFLGAWCGASLGFLWHNAPPAKIFMGDTGSLSAGASLGLISLIIKHEIIWGLIGGVFVIEALSVILQVGYFKITKGKRIFLMAPLHHHFEAKGYSEPTIVIRFWIISIIFALLGLISLKIR